MTFSFVLLACKRSRRFNFNQKTGKRERANANERTRGWTLRIKILGARFRQNLTRRRRVIDNERRDFDNVVERRANARQRVLEIFKCLLGLRG